MTLARAISILGHPFVTMPLAVAWASRAFGLGDRVALVVGGGLAVSVLIVALYSIIKVRRGEFTNLDVSNREQRPRFYAVLIASTLTCVGIFVWLDVPVQVIRGTLVSTCLMIASLIVNFWLKCSLHVAYTIFPLAVIWRTVGTSIHVGGVLFVLLMMWSRVRMGRHTLAETVAGAILGTIAGIVLNVG